DDQQGRPGARDQGHAPVGANRHARESHDQDFRPRGARPRRSAARRHRHEDRLAPRVAIVASGSELVRGDRQDRNGPYLAADFGRGGAGPAAITIVGDDAADLEAALRAGLAYDLLVVSGGLGPTHDDRTIELLARAAGVGLHVDEELEAAIEELSRSVAT